MNIRIPRFAVFAALLLAAGCVSSRVAPVTGAPVADADGLAAQLSAATTPSAPYQVNFAWTLEEGGSRANGRGVVRVEAPERIRLDLFGPRGETYLVAALADGEYRFPPAVRSPVELPSPVLLWGALGVFQIPAGATLSSATVDGATTQLRYTAPNGDLYLFAFAAGTEGSAPRPVRIERAVGQGVVESVTIARDGNDEVTRTEYRDWTAFRNLTLTVESRRDVDSFPQEIWRPDA